MMKKKIIIPIAVIACAGVIVISAVLVLRNKEEEETVYRETTVEYGNLTVGISEDSSVAIGTVEQTFDLDISALVSEDSTSASLSSGDFGMGQNIGGMLSFGNMGTVYSSESQALEVDEVYVTVGQEIETGTPLFHVTADSVEEIRASLEEDVSDTLEDYETLQVEQQQWRVQASQGYDTYVTNGKYASLVYENTVKELQEKVDEASEDVESLTEENENLLQEIEASARTLNQAALDLEKGKLEAKKTCDTDTYYAGAASEWYNIQTSSLDSELQSAQDSYEEAVEKLEEFDSYIVDNTVLSEYSGVITQISVEAGDSVSRNSSLVVLYDKEAVTMEVSLAEEDYQTIDMEGNVNISYTAYPDTIYTGAITEVSDAEYDSSSGEIYYTVTVTVQGDVTGLYEGMTGEVTFVTKETKEVLYVSNRAIFREGTRSYVKLRGEDGNVEEKDVTTGFSDGIHVEIVEGLSEGDVVLIESKVTDQ